MTKNWKGWEVWRFIRDESGGQFIITSWAHDTKVLCSGPEGQVYVTANKEGTWEKWRIVSHSKSESLRIESVEHRRFLSFSGQDLYTENEDGDDTSWFIEPAHGNHFFLSSTSHDKRVSSSSEYPFASKNRDAWEKWVIEPSVEEIGQYTIRSVEHGKYLGADEDGRITVNMKKQLWTIAASTQEGGGGYLLYSNELGRGLTLDENGNLYAEEDGDNRETWQLEPILENITGSENQYEGVTVDEPEKYPPLCSWRLFL